jgi:hypothetical protein
MWCSCGVWQDTLLPCQHACAVYCKAKLADKNYIPANLIDVYYIHGCVQAAFKRNIYPVSLDFIGLQRWNATSPGYNSHCRSAKNKTRAASEDSPISCSNCGQAGHNKRRHAGFKKGWTKYKWHYRIIVGTGVASKSLLVMKRYDVLCEGRQCSTINIMWSY